ncbi:MULTISPECIES: ATP-binding protein [unclassified Paraburkholderia]|uniref:ATP-binding protein n=1 Tax=unclassified Paraburkholderia TaxID=2615204 RepID=UPI002AB0FA00|nr:MULTISPECIES: ATP-binding protein [unclassified Paraburkholderia]
MNGNGTTDRLLTQVSLRSDEEIVRLRQIVRDEAIAHGFSLIEQTRFVTAASELARNTLQYGGGGDARLDAVSNGVRVGLKLTFTDQGPGIPDIERALQDGFTSGNGLGLGLGGSRRLCDAFTIDSTPGSGTTVTIIKWKVR